MSRLNRARVSVSFYRDPAALRAGRRAPLGLVASALVLALPLQALGADPVDLGRRFLGAAQLGQRTVSAGRLVDAAEAIEALEPSLERDLARLTLSLSVPEDRQSALQRISALAGTAYADPGAGAELSALASGERGLARGAAGADALVVAAGLRACVRDGCGPGLVASLLSSLAACARQDGSFSFADNDGDVAVTAEVVRALRELPASHGGASLEAPASAWLRAHLDATALPAADLALILLALSSDDPLLASALSAELQQRQEVNGGFDGGDVRATALAVQALRRGLPDLSIGMAPIQPGEPVRNLST